MPEMTGVEFLARVCERHPNTTRIILTGYADGDAMVRAINEGHVYAYVTKPWEPDELKQLVHRAVELHRLRVQNERLLDDVQQANRFLAAAIDEIPVGALVVDAAGVVRATNRSGREYLGLRADPRGQALADVLGGDALREVRETATRLGEDRRRALRRARALARRRLAATAHGGAHDPPGRAADRPRDPAARDLARAAAPPLRGAPARDQVGAGRICARDSRRRSRNSRTARRR